MKVGLRIPPHPPFERMRSLLRRVADSALTSVWWPDHTQSLRTTTISPQTQGRVPIPIADLNTYLDPFIAIAGCADACAGLAVGVCVTDAVRRMPATLAQTALSLAHLTAGRVVIGLGAGERPNYRPYGWDCPSPAERLREAASDIASLLAGGPAAAGGRLALRIPLTEQSRPQLWIAAHGPRGYETAARYADGWMPTCIDCASWQEGRLAIAASAGGRPVTMALSAQVVSADNHVDAHRYLATPAVRQAALLAAPATFRRYGVDAETIRSANVVQGALALPFELVHDVTPHGTPAEIAAALIAYDGLEHVRLSDIGTPAGAPRGALARLVATAALLA